MASPVHWCWPSSTRASHCRSTRVSLQVTFPISRIISIHYHSLHTSHTCPCANPHWFSLPPTSGNLVAIRWKLQLPIALSTNLTQSQLPYTEEEGPSLHWVQSPSTYTFCSQMLYPWATPPIYTFWMRPLASAFLGGLNYFISHPIFSSLFPLYPLHWLPSTIIFISWKMLPSSHHPSPGTVHPSFLILDISLNKSTLSESLHPSTNTLLSAFAQTQSQISPLVVTTILSYLPSGSCWVVRSMTPRALKPWYILAVYGHGQSTMPGGTQWNLLFVGRMLSSF